MPAAAPRRSRRTSRKVADCERLAAEAVAAFGTVDILINNAGVYHPLPMEETTEELWDSQIDINLKGSFFMAKAVAPVMKAKGAGKIVNITSTLGIVGSSAGAAYCASKGGQMQLTKALGAGARAARDQRQRGGARRHENRHERGDPRPARQGGAHGGHRADRPLLDGGRRRLGRRGLPRVVGGGRRARRAPHDRPRLDRLVGRAPAGLPDYHVRTIHPAPLVARAARALSASSARPRTCGPATTWRPGQTIATVRLSRRRPPALHAALGADPRVGQGAQRRLQDDQRALRDRAPETLVPRRLQARAAASSLPTASTSGSARARPSSPG